MQVSGEQRNGLDRMETESTAMTETDNNNTATPTTENAPAITPEATPAPTPDGEENIIAVRDGAARLVSEHRQKITGSPDGERRLRTKAHSSPQDR